MARPSWWLKFERAKRHFAEFEAELRKYRNSHPYRAEQVRYRENHRSRWKYVLRITEQPPAELALALGDGFHNLRCALDHIANALVPSDRQTDAYFPIFLVDPWATDERGEFIVTDEADRIRFERAVRGMPTKAIAYIMETQPYNRYPDRPAEYALSSINRLDNADKHRRLITYGHGLIDVVASVSASGFGIATVARDARTLKPGVLEDGDEIFGDETALPSKPVGAEVDMQIRGTVEVALRVGHSEWSIPASYVIGHSELIAEIVLERLDQYVTDPGDRYIRDVTRDVPWAQWRAPHT